MNGLSQRAVDAALDDVTYNPAVKRHDGGAAMFGHNFASFAASHVTPGMVARGRAELKRYAGPLAEIEQRFGVPAPVLVAIWGQETGFGGDIGSLPDLQRARDARLGLPPPAAFPRRAYRRDRPRRPGHCHPAARFAGGLGRRGRPDAAHAFGLSHVRDDAQRFGDARPHPQFRRRARLDRGFPQRSRLAAWRGLERRRAQLRRHPAMELGRDLRKDSRAVRRQARRDGRVRFESAPKSLTLVPYRAFDQSGRAGTKRRRSFTKTPGLVGSRMTIFERRALSPPGASAKRSLAALAGLTLTASVALLLHRAAPGAPAGMRAGVTAVSGLAALALAFTLDEAALPRLAKAVAAGGGIDRSRRARRARGAGEARELRFRCVRRRARAVARPHRAEAAVDIPAACGAVRRHARVFSAPTRPVSSSSRAI